MNNSQIMETSITQDSLLHKVELALDSIRPYMEADGGNIKIVEITPDMIVKVELVGNCGTCPMSTMTMKAGVEQAILKMVPEIVGVVAVN